MYLSTFFVESRTTNVQFSQIFPFPTFSYCFISRSTESMNFPSILLLQLSRTVDFAYMHVQWEWRCRRKIEQKSSHIIPMYICTCSQACLCIHESFRYIFFLEKVSFLGHAGQKVPLLHLKRKEM